MLGLPAPGCGCFSQGFLRVGRGTWEQLEGCGSAWTTNLLDFLLGYLPEPEQKIRGKKHVFFFVCRFWLVIPSKGPANEWFSSHRVSCVVAF